MELKHLLKEIALSERNRRQVLSPLATLASKLPDYSALSVFDQVQKTIIEQTRHDIWEQQLAWHERIQQAMSPLRDVGMMLQQHTMEMHDAMSPMRRMAAEAIESAERAYLAAQPLRDAVANLQQHAQIMNAFQPAEQYLHDIYARSLIFDTDEITRIISESAILAQTRALEFHGPNLADALAKIPRLNEDWLSAVGRFEAPALNFYAPVITIPTREARRSIQETRIIIGDDEADETIEQLGLPELEVLIADISVELLSSYRGAIRAARRRDDDYQRQAVVSIRIFLQSLLEKMAPDDECEKYNLATGGTTLSGAPSWRLRLLTAYAILGQPELTTAMEHRALIMRHNMDVLQDVVHVLPQLHSHDQFEHFFNNALGTIKSILEVYYLARRGR